MKIKFKIIILIILLLECKISIAQKQMSSLERINYFCNNCDRDLFINNDYRRAILDSKQNGFFINIYEKNHNFYCLVTDIRKDTKSEFQIEGQWVIDVGQVQIDNLSSNVIIVMGIGGSGSIGNVINLINLESLNYINLSYIQGGQELPILSRSDNFYNLKIESDFLEKLKYEYGFFDAESISDNNSNPEYMMETWKYYNDEVNNEKMKINNYKSTPPYYETNGLETLETDELILTSYFKSGVIAKNKNSNSFFVLFVPKNSYCWIQTMEKYKEYIILGTRGEGLAIINLNSLVLKRIDLGEDYNDVKKLSVVNDRITINDNKKIKFKDF